MAIQHQVLGEPGRHNALLVRIWTGQATHRLLFDCGEGCLSALSAAEIRAIDALFFSGAGKGVKNRKSKRLMTPLMTPGTCRGVTPPQSGGA